MYTIRRHRQTLEKLQTRNSIDYADPVTGIRALRMLSGEGACRTGKASQRSIRLACIDRRCIARNKKPVNPPAGIPLRSTELVSGTAYGHEYKAFGVFRQARHRRSLCAWHNSGVGFFLAQRLDDLFIMEHTFLCKHTGRNRPVAEAGPTKLKEGLVGGH